MMFRLHVGRARRIGFGGFSSSTAQLFDLFLERFVFRNLVLEDRVMRVFSSSPAA